MKKLILLQLFLMMSFLALAHPWKPRHFIIIDTDGGFDDFRAINLLLASPEVRVLAITSSNGVLSAEQCAIKIKSLLYDLHHEGILVGINTDSTNMAVDCLPAVNFSWGTTYKDSASIPVATRIIDFVLRNTNEKITFICLGGLGTIVRCNSEVDRFDEKIKQVIWSNDLLLNGDNFNFSINPSYYKVMSEDYSISIHRVCGTIGESVYDDQLIRKLGTVKNLYAEKIVSSLLVKDTPYASHWYDESVALYLHFPELFLSDTGTTDIFNRILPEMIETCDVKVMEILQGVTINQNQVLLNFPMEISEYQDDVQQIMSATVRKYGKEEWIACVLANELHRHLGVYAIVGAKMGIRVREYFGAGVDEMNVVSYAGLQPPYSCMNDGLQVSTGATLGHGLIWVQQEKNHLPKADFTYLGQTISVVLKDEYRVKIESQIDDLSNIYGLNNDIYWALIRNLAIFYWANWDRNDIFEIQIIHSQ